MQRKKNSRPPAKRPASAAPDRSFWALYGPALVVIAWFILRLGAFVQLRLNPDVRYYFEIADKWMRGLHPYSDFAFEYPPLALVPFVIPRWFTFDLDTYWLIFAWLMTLVDGVLCVLLWRVARLLNPTNVANAVGCVIAYQVLTAFVWPLPITRFDVICALFVTAWLLQTLRGTRLWLADLFLCLGFWTKLVPILLVPLYLTYVFVRTPEGESAWRRVGIRVATLSAWFAGFGLAFLGVYGTALWQFIAYHGNRGLQVESTYAGFFWLLAMMPNQPALKFLHAYGAMELSHPWVPAVAFWAGPIAIVGLIMVWARFMARIARSSRDLERSVLLVRGCVAVFGVFLALNKVFSPQYLVWLAPFVGLLWHKQNRWIMPAAGVMFLLTGFGYGAGSRGAFDYLFAMAPYAIATLVIRNAILAVLVIALCDIPWSRLFMGRRLAQPMTAV